MSWRKLEMKLGTKPGTTRGILERLGSFVWDPGCDVSADRKR
jgi:hypothetical protein